MKADYDLIIVGCGPAGLAAGLYAGQARLKVLILGKEAAGGPIRGYEKVENYPGFPDGISGAKLGLQMMKQVMKYGIEFKLAEVEKIDLENDFKRVSGKITGGSEMNYLAPVVIIAGGGHPKKLGVPGEDALAGKGVSYCGVCDAPQFKEKVIAVAGGGDAGLTEALYLERIAAEITVIEEFPELTANRVLQEKVLDNSKIKIRCGTRIESIKGNGEVKELAILDILENKKTKLEVGGVLIRIGLEPNTDYLQDLLSLSEDGFILVNQAMETSVSGIFAAGDIRYGSARQIATAVGDGVTAALSAGKLVRLKY